MPPSALFNPSTLSPNAFITSSDFTVSLLITLSNCFAICLVESTGLAFSFLRSLSMSAREIFVPYLAFTLSIATVALAASISGTIRFPPITTIQSAGLPVNCETNVFNFCSAAGLSSSPIVADVTAKLT